ncbi:universal stress protein [Shimia sp. R10_1]|uniref:universal stress protein n=1 Tax=Shimia sp. R10_1 TaxID=2821095 RepID=UPI001ADA9CAF|nr:universal stress protein [Shimia sp. R10_1]MBO9474627.1 universal stress protein [Shimia sp. R10_1]
MYDKILVPMALNHDISPETLAAAKALCKPSGEIIALHVYESPHSMAKAALGEKLLQQGFETAKDLLREKTASHPEVKPVIVTGHSYRTIVEYAADNDIGCIVMASHKPDLSDYLLGSTAARVVRHASCSVLVYRA